VTYTDADGNTWNSNLNVVINAPAFDCATGFEVNDSQGNGNGRIEAGETVTITFPVTNSGHAATANDVMANLTVSTSGVTVSNSSLNLGVIAAGQTAQAVYTITVDATVTAATLIEMLLNLPIAFYGMDCEASVTANQNMEDWETGDDNSYSWNYSGDADWFVTSAYAYEGNYSMQSGSIADNDLTSMYIVVDSPANFEFSFSFKTSTEDGYDFLSFLIDNVEQGSWSGENDWTEMTYTLAAGSHNLRWRYSKDFTVGAGEDACWVDNIVLPSSALTVGERELTANLLTVYPNPASEFVQWTVQPVKNGMATLRVLNSLGACVEEIDQMAFGSAQQSGRIDCSTWAAGIYTIQLVQASGIESLKFIVE